MSRSFGKASKKMFNRENNKTYAAEWVDT